VPYVREDLMGGENGYTGEAPHSPRNPIRLEHFIPRNYRPNHQFIPDSLVD
jgi:hypothetical protein